MTKKKQKKLVTIDEYSKQIDLIIKKNKKKVVSEILMDMLDYASTVKIKDDVIISKTNKRRNKWNRKDL